MKVLPFKIPKPESDALVYQEDMGALYDKLHQHEEVQISLIVKGEGTLVVGDTVNDYKTGDVLVIGGNVPHVFQSDAHETPDALMQTLFFSKASFGEQFFNLEELKELSPFFERAKHGFKVHSHKAAIISIFKELGVVSKLRRFQFLLELLRLCVIADYKSLSSFVYNKNYTTQEGERMRDVLDYTMNHFRQTISLEAISEVAVMTKTAFCKYFKRHTNKTYIQFLNELRVEHATKLLISKAHLQVVEIAEMSGFKNISNFNRQFKAVKGDVPSRFRNGQ